MGTSNNEGKNPLVSVVVCTYNRATALERCIRSLRAQDYAPFEVIVVNGPSTDDTLAIIGRYPDIRVVQQQRLEGISSARNQGVRAAAGELIAFIDDDAVAPGGWLGLMAGRMRADPAIAGIGGKVIRLGTDKVEYVNGIVRTNGEISARMPSPQDYNDPQGRVFNWVSGNNMMFRKAVLEAIGGFDAYYRYFFDETDVAVRLILAGHKIVHEPGAVVQHEKAIGLNRHATWDMDWYSIGRMRAYFAVKNFGERQGALWQVLGPLKADVSNVLCVWLYCKNGKVGPVRAARISLDLTRGCMAGVRDGRNRIRAGRAMPPVTA